MGRAACAGAFVRDADAERATRARDDLDGPAASGARADVRDARCATRGWNGPVAHRMRAQAGEPQDRWKPTGAPGYFLPFTARRGW